MNNLDKKWLYRQHQYLHVPKSALETNASRDLWYQSWYAVIKIIIWYIIYMYIMIPSNLGKILYHIQGCL